MLGGHSTKQNNNCQRNRLSSAVLVVDGVISTGDLCSQSKSIAQQINPDPLVASNRLAAEGDSVVCTQLIRNEWKIRFNLYTPAAQEEKEGVREIISSNK